MRTIVDKIAKTIERVELGKNDKKLPFIYADLHTQNILLDNIEPPYAISVLLESGAVKDEHNNYHEQATLEVYFADLMRDDTGDLRARRNEHIIDECKQRAYKWLASLVNNPDLQLVSINGATRSYWKFDVQTTGYSVSVTLKELQGYGRCQIGE